MANKKKIKKVSWLTAFRRTWEISPITKVVPSKKAYKRKPKHKNKGEE